MVKRFLITTLLATALLGIVTTTAYARGLRQPVVTDLWIFGDSLSDTGNLAALFSGSVPGDDDDLYFNGRFSDGPVWVEPFATKLGLSIDFDTPVSGDPFARNRAVAGAFTGIGDEFGFGKGVLTQVNEFLMDVGTVDENELVVIWAGANDYFFLPGTPEQLVNAAISNLATAVQTLAIAAGAERFLVLNLPALGETALANFLMLPPAQVEGLNQLAAAHNEALAFAMAQVSDAIGVEIILVDVNSAFAEVLDRQRLYGFTNVTQSCVSQLPGPNRVSTMLCPDDDMGSLDSTGFVFWDLIHPTSATHKLVAVFAHATLVARENLPITVFDPERVSTRIALAKLRVFGVLNNLGRFARRGDDSHMHVLQRNFQLSHGSD